MMTGRQHRALLYVMAALSTAGFAVDGAASRIAGWALLVSTVLLVDARALAAHRALGTIALALAFAAGTGVAFNLLKVGPALVFHGVVIMTGLLVGFALSRRPSDEVAVVSRWTLLTYQGVLLLQIARGAVDLNGLSLPGASGSTNLVSGILLFLQLWHVGSAYRATQRAPLALPLLSAALAFPMKGRSGIALLGGLALVCLLQRWTLLSARWRTGLAAGGALVIAGLVPILAEPVAALVQTTRLIHGFGDESRSIMRAEYLDALTPWSAIAGGAYTASPAILTLSGNPHNSFIRAHYLFGLPVLLCLAALLVMAAVATARAPRARWFPFALLLSFTARAFVDAMAFPGLMDFVFFFLLFLVVSPPSLAGPDGTVTAGATDA